MLSTIINQNHSTAGYGVGPSDGRYSLAILAFCQLNGLKEKVSAHPLARPAISLLDPSCQYAGKIGNRQILLLESVPSGPGLMVILEAISRMGIKSVIGYGFADSLTTLIPEGQIVLAESAVDIGSDRRRQTVPDSNLFHRVRLSAARQCLSLRRARILNTDSTEPDYRHKIAQRRELDVEVVHRDTWMLLDASRRCELSAVFLCVIGQDQADQLDEETDPICRGRRELEDLIAETLEQSTASAANYG